MDGGYRPQVRVSEKQLNCLHTWLHNQEVHPPQPSLCTSCKRDTVQRARIHCPQCLITVCNLCGSYYFNKEVPAAPAAPAPFFPQRLKQEQQYYIAWCQGEIERLQKEVKYYKAQFEELLMEKDLAEDFNALNKVKGPIDLLTKRPACLRRQPTCYLRRLLVGSQRLSKLKIEGPRLVKNMLYNLKVELEIPGVPRFSLKAILDTGATTCCVDLKLVPKEALEENTFIVHFSGINFHQTTKMKLRQGRMFIGENTFRIPYTYSFPMLKERQQKLESWRGKEKLLTEKRADKKELLRRQSSEWVSEDKLEDRIMAAIIGTTIL